MGGFHDAENSASMISLSDDRARRRGGLPGIGARTDGAAEPAPMLAPANRRWWSRPSRADRRRRGQGPCFIAGKGNANGRVTAFMAPGSVRAGYRVRDRGTIFESRCVWAPARCGTARRGSHIVHDRAGPAKPVRCPGRRRVQAASTRNGLFFEHRGRIERAKGEEILA